MKRMIIFLLTFIFLIGTTLTPAFATDCFTTITETQNARSYAHELYTDITNTYTKIESAGNYARSNTIRIEYLQDCDNLNRRVSFKVVEHKFLAEDEEYYVTLSVGEHDIITLDHTGNNYTIYAKFENSTNGRIKTLTCLYKA